MSILPHKRTNTIPNFEKMIDGKKVIWSLERSLDIWGHSRSLEVIWGHMRPLEIIEVINRICTFIRFFRVVRWGLFFLLDQLVLSSCTNWRWGEEGRRPRRHYTTELRASSQQLLFKVSKASTRKSLMRSSAPADVTVFSLLLLVLGGPSFRGLAGKLDTENWGED